MGVGVLLLRHIMYNGRICPDLKFLVFILEHKKGKLLGIFDFFP